MGTRADYYIKRKNGKLEWMGSTGWDGYPDNSEYSKLLQCVSLAQFQQELSELSKRDDFTSPSDGWPWPWDTSKTTDYSYIFDCNTRQVYISNYGSKQAKGKEMAHLNQLNKNLQYQSIKTKSVQVSIDAVGKAIEKAYKHNIVKRFPIMDTDNVQLGAKSGLIVIGG